MAALRGRRYFIGALVAALALAACRGAEEKRPTSAAAAPPPPAGVDVRVTAWSGDDRALPAGVAVYDAGAHRAARWEGVTGERFALPPGRYDVLIEYYGQKYWRRGEDVAGGELAFRLPMATLVVEARSSRGETLPGEVEVYPAGRMDEPPVMEGAAFEELAVLAGTYDVRARIEGRDFTRRAVTLEEADRAVVAFVEPVGYLLATVVDERGEPLAAEVRVYPADEPTAPVATARAGEPVPLFPGRYDVAVRQGEDQDYAAGLAVTMNQTTEERFVFARGEKR